MIPEGMRMALMRMHYAAWASACGLMNLAAALNAGTTDEIKVDSIGKPEILAGRACRRVTPPAPFNLFSPAFYIDQGVLEAILTGTSDQVSAECEAWSKATADHGLCEALPDGTALAAEGA